MDVYTILMISLVVLSVVVYSLVKSAWDEAVGQVDKLLDGDDYCSETSSRVTPPAPPIPDDPGDYSIEAETPSVPHCNANERS